MCYDITPLQQIMKIMVGKLTKETSLATGTSCRLLTDAKILRQIQRTLNFRYSDAQMPHAISVTHFLALVNVFLNFCKNKLDQVTQAKVKRPTGQ